MINKNWINELYNIPTWKKYSQCNEESYLQHILSNVPSLKNYIVELGAWDGYHLSNTRYFIENGYSALLIDGDNKGNEEVKQHFIMKENVLELLKKYKAPKAFDLFCIDLDGNDIYILDEVLTKYRPSVIIAEFNPKFQPNESVAITYNPEHTWGEDDYYGFSFAAGLKMASKNGYTCIFQNDNLNMYFVDNDVLLQSLGLTNLSELENAFPIPSYIPSVYHPTSYKQTWVEY